MFGGPAGPVPTFGEPDGTVVGCAALFDVAVDFGDCAIRAGRFCRSRGFVELRGACTVIAGKTAGFDELLATTGAAPADSGPVTVCANVRCWNVVISTEIKASSRTLFDGIVKRGTQSLRPGRVRLRSAMYADPRTVMLQRHLKIPSHPSSRVDKVRHNDTIRIWDSFIHMMMDMDVLGAIRHAYAGENALIISSISTEAAAVRVTVTKSWRHETDRNAIEIRRCGNFARLKPCCLLIVSPGPSAAVAAPAALTNGSVYSCHN
jgi:hypothetical protein